MGTQLTPQARLANLAKQAISTLKPSAKNKTVRQKNRTITIIEVKKQPIPGQEQQTHKSLMEYRCKPIPDTSKPEPHTSQHETSLIHENHETTPQGNEDDFKKLITNKKSIKQKIKTLKKRNEKDWNSMKKTFKQKNGFTKLLDSIKNTKFEKIKDIGPKAFFAANLYIKHKINDSQMRDFLDTLMERYIEEKANLQLQPALAAINDSPNPPVMAAEFIATIQERIDNPDKTYSSQIKIEIPLDVGWSDETYKAFANSSDKQLMENILHHTTNNQSNEKKASSAELSETATETINQYIENQLKEKKYKLYGMKRHCSEETEITDKILEKAMNRHNNICKVLVSLAPEFSTPDDNKTTVFAAYLNSVIDSWTVEDDQPEHADVSVDNIEKSSSKVASERARESSDDSQRTEDKLGVMDDSIENAPETHSASMNDAIIETHLPRSILKELATESSTTAEDWRASGRLNKLETDKTGIAEKADETSHSTNGEQQSAESLAQQTAPPVKDKPAPNKRPKGLTLKGRTKPQVTTNTEILKDKPALKKKPELPPKPDKSILNSSVKTQENQKTETQKVKPALKRKPKFLKQPDESTAQSTVKTQETKKPDTQPTKPPLPKKPEKLAQAQHQKPVTPTAPLKEKQIESDAQALTGTGDQPQTPGTVQHNKNSQNITPTTVTADSIVAKITGQIEGEEYKLQAEVMSDVLKLAGQPDQLRKLLEQLDQAVSAGIDIKVIRGNEQLFRDQLVSLIDNQKPNALDSVHRTGIEVKH